MPPLPPIPAWAIPPFVYPLAFLGWYRRRWLTRPLAVIAVGRVLPPPRPGAATPAAKRNYGRMRVLQPLRPGAAASPAGSGRPFDAEAVTDCRRRRCPAPPVVCCCLRGRALPSIPSLTALGANHPRRGLPPPQAEGHRRCRPLPPTAEGRCRSCLRSPPGGGRRRRGRVLFLPPATASVGSRHCRPWAATTAPGRGRYSRNQLPHFLTPFPCPATAAAGCRPRRSLEAALPTVVLLAGCRHCPLPPPPAEATLAATALRCCHCPRRLPSSTPDAWLPHRCCRRQPAAAYAVGSCWFPSPSAVILQGPLFQPGWYSDARLLRGHQPSIMSLDTSCLGLPQRRFLVVPGYIIHAAPIGAHTQRCTPVSRTGTSRDHAWRGVGHGGAARNSHSAGECDFFSEDGRRHC